MEVRFSTIAPDHYAAIRWCFERDFKVEYRDWVHVAEFPDTPEGDEAAIEFRLKFRL